MKRSGGEAKRISLLLVIVLGTIIISSVMAGLVIWMSGESIASFEDFIVASKHQETMSVAESVSKDFDALITLMYNELSEPGLTKLRLFYESNLLNYSYLEQANLVQKQLYAMESALAFSPEIKVYLLDYQRVISSSSILRYNEDTGRWLQTVQQQKEGGFYADQEDLYFVLSKQAGDSIYRQNLMVVAKLSQYSVTRYLRAFTPADDVVSLAMFVQGKEEARHFASSNYSFSNVKMKHISSQITGQEKGGVQYSEDGERYLLTWAKTRNAQIKLCQVTPMNALTSRLIEYRNMTSVVIVLVILLGFALVLFLYSVVSSPIRKMKQALRQIEDGNLKVRTHPTWSREFQEIFMQFNQMAEKLEYLIEQEYKLNLLNVKAEIKQMRYQISPHFLYNSYFNLRAMLIDEDYEHAQKMADYMGRYLRYITTSMKEEATLQEELDHSLAYVEIQKLRFGDHLEVRINQFPDYILPVNIPRIIIQPLIENAFEHGIKNRNEKGIIGIRVHLDNDMLSIIVEDNGQSASDQVIKDLHERLRAGHFDEDSDSVALININRRVELLYQEGSGLFVSRSSLGGIRSEIRMKGVMCHVSNDDC